MTNGKKSNTSMRNRVVYDNLHVRNVYREFLSRVECDKLVQRVTDVGFVPLGFKSVHRISDQCIIFDNDLASFLWKKLEKIISTECKTYTYCGKEWTAIGLNECFRFARYQIGNYFKPHYDNSYERSTLEKSFLSCFIYLNEPPEFTGGNTQFLEGNRFGPTQVIESIVPATGTCLVFDQGMLHEGSVLTSGVKYIMRTDVMFKCENR